MFYCFPQWAEQNSTRPENVCIFSIIITFIRVSSFTLVNACFIPEHILYITMETKTYITTECKKSIYYWSVYKLQSWRRSQLLSVEWNLILSNSWNKLLIISKVEYQVSKIKTIFSDINLKFVLKPGSECMTFPLQSYSCKIKIQNFVFIVFI